MSAVDHAKFALERSSYPQNRAYSLKKGALIVFPENLNARRDEPRDLRR
jgi:hypothetical protein